MNMILTRAQGGWKVAFKIRILFLATNQELPGSILGATRVSEKEWSATGSTQPREINSQAIWLKSGDSGLENRD
jgi:hypothetical protein